MAKLSAKNQQRLTVMPAHEQARRVGNLPHFGLTAQHQTINVIAILIQEKQSRVVGFDTSFAMGCSLQYLLACSTKSYWRCRSHTKRTTGWGLNIYGDRRRQQMRVKRRSNHKTIESAQVLVYKLNKESIQINQCLKKVKTDMWSR